MIHRSLTKKIKQLKYSEHIFFSKNNYYLTIFSSNSMSLQQLLILSYSSYNFNTCSYFSSIYIYCENAVSNSDGTYGFETKNYSPKNPSLQTIVSNLKAGSEKGSGTSPWQKYLADALVSLKADNETDFSQPPLETDKLYMAIGQQDIIEVAHPSPLPGSDGPVMRRYVIFLYMNLYYFTGIKLYP